MQTIKEKISKEKYEELKKLSGVELRSKIREEIPITWSCGYGWYGCELKNIDDEYYIEHTLGSSCD